MNANRKTIVVSTMTAALAAVAVSFPAAADHRDLRRAERQAVIERHAPQGAAVRRADFPEYAQSRRVFTEREEFRHRPPVVHHRPVIVHRPVVVERPVVVHRTVVVQRPAPVYYHQPRPVLLTLPNRCITTSRGHIGMSIGRRAATKQARSPVQSSVA